MPYSVKKTTFTLGQMGYISPHVVIDFGDDDIIEGLVLDRKHQKFVLKEQGDSKPPE